ncbi:CehA/McbA family metallohydrolase [Acidicapsa dinghuensis]|uniref:CehA/McbA family metallohydrolase n=1 Tax=Acidicapsa dinghuensis TaxID=2218256 RepID=A0ABW1EMX0_9BACT|nr:CehA/McbA family metallohydrolase [Acidicapsa dinghuensis]
MDLGIADPDRFRGNSGGNKSHFTIGEADATPSYLPGPIPAGRWRLLISVPNIRAHETSTYHAEIRFNSSAEEHGFTLDPLATGTRWYRGDLHMHTAHSDGSCESQSGKRVPCPVFLTAETAAQRGLDFIAITDHNTTSQYDDMRELQPYFDKLLLIPGREITTFWGHFNIFGVTQFVDYREGSGGLDVNAILRDVRAKGGIASVNHADSPTGEICMGCGWTPKTQVDMSLFTGVEVINGGGEVLSSEDFWDRQIAAGAKLTAVGGSDNHHATSEAGRPGSIGWPTTVVEATELSVPAVLEGIRKGRVFVDLTASHDKVVDLEARDVTQHSSAADHTARMGETLDAFAGDTLDFQVRLTACPQAKVYLFLDGIEDSLLPPLDAGEDKEELPFHWKTDGREHWIRVEVRDSNGSLMLVSNPIYIHPVAH